MSAAPLPEPEADRPALTLGELEHSPGFLLQIARIAHVEALSHLLPATDLRLSEYAVLVAVAENPGVRQGELGDLLHIKWSHMTKIVRKLEDQGFLERIVLPQDRRSVRLGLTEAARDALARMRVHLAAAGRQAMPMLDDAEVSELVRLLRKVAGRPWGMQ